MTTSDTANTTANEAVATPEATPCPFNIGDIVFLKGSPEVALTVEGMFTHPQDAGAWIIAVAWLDHQWQLQHGQFHPSALDPMR
ncbi:hypothetical protein ACRQ5Q_14975 [Bradyrhizobium sp. PMVTL-01]|uniref:hypothetical protein n=1 Tax=Bradyrhizobium sp. PMVTL-01 TaxID=3434999 RepID=UPI003F713CC2